MSSMMPLTDRVLVKPDEAEQKTASGRYIASNAQEKPQRGTIVAVGAGKVNDKGERIPMDVKVGDVVIYGKFGGNEVKASVYTCSIFLHFSTFYLLFPHICVILILKNMSCIA